MCDGVNCVCADTPEYMSRPGTILHLRTLQAQGRQLRVAGVKFSEWYPSLLDVSLPGSYGEFRDFATMADVGAVDAFKRWIEEGGRGGNLEYQLDILMFAKNLSSAAYPGLYIALATDDVSLSEPRLLRQEVASALAEAGCMPFIDCRYVIDPANQDLVSYYTRLAVNGGAVEEASVGTFTFPLLRQAIVGL